MPKPIRDGDREPCAATPPTGPTNCAWNSAPAPSRPAWPQAQIEMATWLL